MRKRMGTFYTNCRVENQVDRKKSAEVPKMLVDTGVEFTWINAGTLKKIGVKREKKDYAFVMANRLNDRPRALSGKFVEVSCWTDQEVMATMGRLRKIPAYEPSGLAREVIRFICSKSSNSPFVVTP